MVIYVRDQYGQVTPNAQIVVRDRWSYRWVGDITTNQDGYAQIVLDTSLWYVVEAYYTEFDIKEFWTYKYIGPDDWGSIYPYGIKVLQRDDPWISQVILPDGDLDPGQPAQIEADIDHGLPQTNFGLFCRMTLIVDDDGAEPYIYQHTTDEQLIAEGFQPFAFEPTMSQPGEHQVRLILERRFEGNDWNVSDDSGWAWTLTVAQASLPLHGLIYLDWDGDGIQDAGEPQAANAQVQLYDHQDAMLGETTSDASGRFDFDGLGMADYALRVAALPAGLGHARPSYPVTLTIDNADQLVLLALDPWLVQVPLVQTR